MPIRLENRKRYPKDWKQISHRIRFDRAGGRCEQTVGDTRCTAEHGKPHPITGKTVVLTVAHLDHTPENCGDDNLKAMCQKCHLAYDHHHHQTNARRTRDRKRGQLSMEIA
ncbi:MAG TPA: hypothetical protein VM639_24480 [Dongiaceae bacterium]|nr:hypothetical protein [Dongiaceae bacterium]